LLEVYDQECARDGDFQRPAEAAIRRFGAARELSDDISADVPWVNRVVFWLIRKKENLMWRLVAFCVLGLALVLVGLGFIMPAVHQLAFQEFAGLSVPLLALGAILALGGVWSFAHGVRRYRMNGA
jgi:uncharacterized membrane protein